MGNEDSTEEAGWTYDIASLTGATGVEEDVRTAATVVELADSRAGGALGERSSGHGGGQNGDGGSGELHVGCCELSLVKRM